MSEFSLAKCMNMILFLCKDGIYKTKLNKEMFYADFKHFKDFGKSITGLKYNHAPFGPVPLMYTVLINSLIEKRKISVKEIPYGSTDTRGDDIVAEQYDAPESPQLSVFTDSELQAILSVKSFFSSFSSRKITGYSH
ncbi:MAG: Panacea domain-containing protein [Candidatus Xenobiia bacterium LiM19]